MGNIHIYIIARRVGLTLHWALHRPCIAWPLGPPLRARLTLHWALHPHPCHCLLLLPAGPPLRCLRPAPGLHLTLFAVIMLGPALHFIAYVGPPALKTSCIAWALQSPSAQHNNWALHALPGPPLAAGGRRQPPRIYAFQKSGGLRPLIILYYIFGWMLFYTVNFLRPLNYIILYYMGPGPDPEGVL